MLDKLSELTTAFHEDRNLNYSSLMIDKKDIQDQDPRELFRQGERLFQERKYIQATRTLRKVLELTPDNLGALYCLGESLLGEEKYIEAKKQFKQALLIKPGFKKAEDRIKIIDKKISNN